MVSTVSVFAGLVLLVPVAYYGDGTGFVIAAFAACPAVAALAAGLAVPRLWRRGRRTAPR